jgi:drug/metabolite transporter (DMT)-like permease
MPALLALIAVTAVWGYTFVPMKDAVALYPLFAFLAVRFLIASVVLAVPAAGGCARSGGAAGSRALARPSARARLRAADGGLARTTVSSAGFITGLYVVFTPLLGCSSSHARRSRGLVRCRTRDRRAGAALRRRRRQLARRRARACGAAAYSLQIALMERYAPRYDPVAFTQAEMLAAFAGFAVVAVALGQVEVPRGWTVWGALLVTGIFASALGFLVQTWAQRRISASRTAIAFAMEPVFAGIFGSGSPATASALSAGAAAR